MNPIFTALAVNTMLNLSRSQEEELREKNKHLTDSQFDTWMNTQGFRKEYKKVNGFYKYEVTYKDKKKIRKGWIYRILAIISFFLMFIFGYQVFHVNANQTAMFFLWVLLTVFSIVGIGAFPMFADLEFDFAEKTYRTDKFIDKLDDKDKIFISCNPYELWTNEWVKK